MTRDFEGRAQLQRMTGQMAVPVITVDGQVVIGFDRPRLEMLLSQATQKRPSLGLSIADASRQALKAGALPVFGAYVGRVAPSSVAERAGIRPHDIVVEANLRPIANAADLEKLLADLPPGSRLTLVVMRGDRKLGFEVTL